MGIIGLKGWSGDLADEPLHGGRWYRIGQRQLDVARQFRDQSVRQTVALV